MEDKSGVPVDRGWAWMIVLGYFCSVFCMVGIAKSFGIFLEEFVDYFNIPVALAALIMGVSGGVYTISAPILVAAGQHFTQRKVVMLGGLVGGVGLILSSLLLSIEWVIITFGALFGFGNACVFGNGLVILGQYFSKYRSIANGLALSGASIGQFALPPLLQYMLDKYSLKGTLLIVGGIYLNVIMCGMLYRPLTSYKTSSKPKSEEEDKLIEGKSEPKLVIKDEETSQPNGEVCGLGSEERESGDGDMKRNEKQTPRVRYRTVSSGSVVLGSVDSLHTLAVDTDNQSSQTKPKDKHQKISLGHKLKIFIKGLLDFSVLKNYVVILFVICSFLLFFGHFNFVLFMPAAAFSRGIDKYEKAWLVSVNGISDLIGRLLVGFAGDLKLLQRYKLMAISTFCCGAAIFCFSFPDTFSIMAIFVSMYGFFGGCYVAINVPTLIDFVGLQTMPKVLGVVLFIQGLGAAFGQPLLGFIRDKMGTYQLVHYINAFCMVLGSIFLFMYPLVKKMEKKRLKPVPSSENELTMEV